MAMKKSTDIKTSSSKENTKSKATTKHKAAKKKSTKKVATQTKKEEKPKKKTKKEIAWDKNEEDACVFITTKFDNAKDMVKNVQRMGGSDSTVSDIKITTTNGGEFYVECKMPNAFAGQFTVTPDGEINLDEGEHEEKFGAASEILKNLDKLFNDTKSEEAQQILSSYMIANYHAKHAPFVCVKYNGEQMLVPLEEVQDAFDFDLDQRDKRSGRSYLCPDNMNIVNEILKNNGMPIPHLCDDPEKYSAFDNDAFDDKDLPIYMPFTDRNGEQKEFMIKRDDKTGQILCSKRGEVKNTTVHVKIHLKKKINKEKIDKWGKQFLDFTKNVNEGYESQVASTKITRSAEPSQACRNRAEAIKRKSTNKPPAGCNNEEWVWVEPYDRITGHVNGYHRSRRASDAPYKG